MTKAEIIQWIKEYKRPIDDVTEFAKELGEKIKTMNFTASNNGAAIGYAGSFNGKNPQYTGLYITVGNVSENGKNLYSYINYSAENILNNEEFLKVLEEAVKRIIKTKSWVVNRLLTQMVYGIVVNTVFQRQKY